ncbi:MAG: hypothetical protein RL487_1398 [Actinomycetota bacterium]|jgi:hypothetical protein
MSTGLTTTEPRGLALSSVDDAMKFGRMLAASEFAPKDFRGKPESCVLAIQHGSEIGLGPMQSIQSIAVINGRPSIWGDAALALVMASAVCEYVRERIDGDGDQAVAVCEAKRRGYPAPTVSRFSVADAKKAGLWGKSGPWTQYPRRMLQLRARGFALRDAFPDVLKGLVTAEEAGDYSPPATAEVPAVHVETDPAPQQERPRWLERVRRAATVVDLGRIADEADKAVTAGDMTESQRTRLDREIDRRHGEIEPVGGDDAGQEFTHEGAAKEHLS